MLTYLNANMLTTACLGILQDADVKTNSTLGWQRQIPLPDWHHFWCEDSSASSEFDREDRRLGDFGADASENANIHPGEALCLTGADIEDRL